MSIVTESAAKSTAKRVTYGIRIMVGKKPLNEWGLHESEARIVNEMLTLNGDKPFTTKDGLTFSRLESSDFAKELAEMKASLGVQE